MTDRELLEMALKALEEVRDAKILALELKPSYHNIISSLHARLAQPEKQAPYLAVYRDGIKMIDPVTGDVSIGTPHPDLAKVGEVGVWGERKWHGLTDDEIDEIIGYVDPHCQEEQFARAIEVKLKEKNHG